MQRDWAEIKMNNVGDKIIELFSNSFELILAKETCDEFITEYQINTLSLSLLEIDVIDKINARDQIAIYFFETDNAESIDYLSINVNSWNDFVYELQAKNIQQGKIKIQIGKGLQNGMLSIYSIDKFTEYINTLSLSQFFAIIDMRFTTSLVFEVQDELYPKWSTNTIAFIGKDGKYEISDMENVNRESRIKEVRNLCYHEIEKYKLLPEDLFYSQYDGNDSLQSAFIKACMIYTFSFVFDYSALKNDNYEYKLNGFRTLSGHIKVKPLSKINVNINSCKLIYEIYKWLYLGENNNDKINIARNIISLNIEKESLYINSSTFESILSNYKIYEKENVKFELSEKAYITMMGYYSDYITLLLYRFYARVTHARQVTVQDLIKLNRYELEDLYEVMQITEAIESSIDQKEIESLKSKMNEKIEDYSKNYENYFEMDMMLVIASNKNLMHRRGSDVYATVRDIASITQKRTDNIIRDITVIMDNIRKVDPKIDFKSIYRATYYTTSKNKEVRTFTMSEEGFVLLICHYDVTMIWMLANFYVEMKKLVVPKITELIIASSDMVYDAIQYHNECDKFLIQLTGVNHNKGANYVEHKEKGIIEQLNAFRKSKEQKLLHKWDPDMKYDDRQMRSYKVTPRYMDL